MKFDFNDIILVPDVVSQINSRQEINVYDDNGMLPIMTAPMDTVVSLKNHPLFTKNKIYSVLPRGANILDNSTDKFVWYSCGLDEFILRFSKSGSQLKTSEKVYVLIDIANGHMEKLINAVEDAKRIYGPTLVIMVGNIANPKTFEFLASAGADYVRCGIGNGSVCTTSANVAVGYPMGSLISEISKRKKALLLKTKIVADGGFKNYSDIIKALGLGADYVMLGGIFNKCYESAGELYEQNDFPQSIAEKYRLFDMNLFNEMHGLEYTNPDFLLKTRTVYKKFRGMSTKEVQRDWNKETLTTSEGISVYNKVEYTLSTWKENFEDYLKSAMSYCGAKNLEEFRFAHYELITQNAFNRFNK